MERIKKGKEKKNRTFRIQKTCMFADREKGVDGKVKIKRLENERVHLVFAIKLQKVVGKTSMKRRKLGPGKEE